MKKGSQKSDGTQSDQLRLRKWQVVVESNKWGDIIVAAKLDTQNPDGTPGMSFGNAYKDFDDAKPLGPQIAERSRWLWEQFRGKVGL